MIDSHPGASSVPALSLHGHRSGEGEGRAEADPGGRSASGTAVFAMIWYYQRSI